MSKVSHHRKLGTWIGRSVQKTMLTSIKSASILHRAASWEASSAVSFSNRTALRIALGMSVVPVAFRHRHTSWYRLSLPSTPLVGRSGWKMESENQWTVI